VATRLREQIYTPLSSNEARELVQETWDLIEGLVTEPEEDADDDGYGVLDVFDDVSLVAEGALPRSARGAPEALERIASCRSALTLEYYGRIFEKQPFIALQKFVFARVGKAVVWRGEAGEDPPAKDAKLMTLEAFIAERDRDVGPRWRETAPLGTSEEPERKPRKTRKAKAGELESLPVHKRLARIIEGNDPLAREALKKALERTTPQVRAYAAALMENGPTPDAELAKELGTPSANVVSAREALARLLKAIR